MKKVALDSNILVYAELEPDSNKGKQAQRILAEAAPRAVVAVQCLLEFVAVIRRKRPESLPSALHKAESWASVFEVAPTTSTVMRDALALVRNHQFQVWDAVICAAASAAGAEIFLSEDLQDGMTLAGMRIVNPFTRDDDALRTLLT